MKIFRATYDTLNGVVVESFEVEEKKKTYKVLAQFPFSIRKDEIGHVFFDRLIGYGLSKEEAVRVLRRLPRRPGGRRPDQQADRMVNMVP